MYVGAGEPVQVPVDAVSPPPSVVVPEIVGSAVFAGATPAGAVTIAVWFDASDAEPAELVAVTSTRIVEPISPALTTYVVPVAPAMLVQFAPAASHCRH